MSWQTTSTGAAAASCCNAAAAGSPGPAPRSAAAACCPVSSSLSITMTSAARPPCPAAAPAGAPAAAAAGPAPPSGSPLPLASIACRSCWISCITCNQHGKGCGSFREAQQYDVSIPPAAWMDGQAVLIRAANEVAQRTVSTETHGMACHSMVQSLPCPRLRVRAAS